MGSDDDGDESCDVWAPRDDVDGPSGAARPKPMWRRFFEVAAPVAVFAAAAPFAVNSLATAVNETVPDREPFAAAASTVETAETAETAEPIVSPTTAVPDVDRVSVAGVAGDADDRTISLATEIVAGTSPATPIAANGAASGGSTSTTSSAPAPNDEGHSHGAVTPEVALTRGERKALADELSTARNSAMQFATVADAEAAGYTMVTGYLPLIGAHYIKWGLMDATFDPAAPEMLLYDGVEPGSGIVGLSYYLFNDAEPSPFTGANDHWHQHIGLCIKDGVVVGGEDTTPEQCTARGGAKAGAANGWMVHAWVVPGWDSPQGVFSPEHVGLTADLPTS